MSDPDRIGDQGPLLLGTGLPLKIVDRIGTNTFLDVPLLWILIGPSQANGLQRRSYVMIDQIFSARSRYLGYVFGHLDGADTVAVNRSLGCVRGSPPSRLLKNSPLLCFQGSLVARMEAEFDVEEAVILQFR